MMLSEVINSNQTRQIKHVKSNQTCRARQIWNADFPLNRANGHTPLGPNSGRVSIPGSGNPHRNSSDTDIFADDREFTPLPRIFPAFGTVSDAFPAGQGYGGTRQEQGT